MNFCIVTQLYSDLNIRSSVTNLISEADKGVTCKRIVLCNINTEGTPYKDGLTNFSSGIAYLNMSTTLFGTIFYVPTGTTSLFVKAKNNGTWAEWSTLSLTTHNHDGRYYTESEINEKLSNLQFFKSYLNNGILSFATDSGKLYISINYGEELWAINMTRQK